jgi:anthranilate synthase/aminodeoxychorismate synthase-like glutamine amidotransferase
MVGRVLLLDNLDSFTHNVAQGLVEAGARVEVLRRDRTTLAALEAAAPELLVLSPGPGRPEDAALALEAVRAFAGRIPILGVCLGHQVLACAFGGEVGRAPEPVHGKAWAIRHDGAGLFTGLPDPLLAGRYHSLVVTAVPRAFQVSARTPEGLVMAMRHRDLPIAGVQFHPDSFLTPHGLEIFRNALLGRF